jgi:creatinine amidohydrolase
MVDEVRLERLRPAQVDAALARASVAWVPMGALEFHAPHLPIGTDGFTAHGLLTMAAEQVGGIVLPWSYLTLGTLRFPWSLRFERGLVEGALRDTLLQLADDGVGVLVVHTGHAPLDLIHLIKRVCGEVEGARPGVRAYGLCYLELNAALGTGLGTAWPVAVDHASTMETSWLQALEPALVDVTALPEGRETLITAVYGPNPRVTADPARGRSELDGAADLLAARVRALVDGGTIDPLADLRTFVERYWPEPFVVGGRAGAAGSAAVSITNPGAVSRYVSGLSVAIDGVPLSDEGLTLVNPVVGEVNEPVGVGSLGAETGFYIRRQQTAELRLPHAVDPGEHRVRLVVGLAGVAERVVDVVVPFQ